jgi:hypothetical protein
MEYRIEIENLSASGTNTVMSQRNIKRAVPKREYVF